MERHLKPIGGEFWIDSSVLDITQNDFRDLKAVFLNGGQSAIRFIIEDSNFKEDEYILMPAYLCPTILYSFERKSIHFVFYEVNEDLSINLNDIKNKLDQYKVKGIFFIDYFGFYHSDQTIQFLKSIQQTGIILIEDAVQMFWFSKKEKFIGDYIFNSYRKFLPIDGSLVLCNKSVDFDTIKDKYYKLINEARLNKTEYVKLHSGNEEEFLKLFNQADKAYYKRENVNGMDNESKESLNKTNYELIKKLRTDNYNYLYEILTKFSNIKILFNKELIEDNVPLAFPILINNRDFIRKELRIHSIYCPIHWDIRNENLINKFEKSIYISNKILTIPIDNRYNFQDMDRVVNAIINLIESGEHLNENI
ncbi:DegT/DnrJ/EryC1/StrS aminotransferase family protein [Clostridium bowmanii]|uniref:DegT/DnrJ/EryC1/StrS aminotransferase family protein n=1 Tax=Clostridium bowmanii TaxID=132925 RepID=UPI001C0DB609|nr:DegT/DnrJ/EryC1/StrS aminotransferase family protein [Clostridium bowmanii]MBU3190617.1 DegT/DnrJ/EryC1/StrS aminotransferase family protein [Clostridium bowmanii]MCA1075150.1 DegT/DnrJ/EryC1/StrS aminotransferase family protein [Clostridium bowmanii]